MVFGVMALVAGLAAVTLPETAHQQLPETIVDAENFGRYVPLNRFSLYNDGSLDSWLHEYVKNST